MADSVGMGMIGVDDGAADDRAAGGRTYLEADDEFQFWYRQ